MRLAWLTDIHLNFLDSEERFAFYRTVAAAGADAILISGDIGEANSVVPLLQEFIAGVGVPLHAVLGNHDFYRGSVAGVRDEVARYALETPTVTYLSAAGVIPLTPRTALVGHDGWGDGGFGNGRTTPVELNDFWLIDELRERSRDDLLAVVARLGAEAAEHFRTHLPAAFDEFEEVIAVTHVPPFAEAAWHQGNPSDPDWLPWFACRAVGEVLRETMLARPDRRLTVLCGHTHGAGVVDVLPNLTVRTGGAVYGDPRVQDVWEVA